MGNPKTFGKQIRAAREAAGWTQDELGVRADGLDQSQVSAIEGGTYPATTEMLRRIAKPFRGQILIDYNKDEPRLILPPRERKRHD